MYITFPIPRTLEDILPLTALTCLEQDNHWANNLFQRLFFHEVEITAVRQYIIAACFLKYIRQICFQSYPYQRLQTLSQLSFTHKEPEPMK